MKKLIPYEYSDKKISPWGGMRLIKELLDNVGLSEKLRSLPFKEPGSGNSTSHSELVESFMVSVILGAGNLTGASQIRYDEVIKEIFQWKKGMPSQSSLSRFFPKYGTDESDAIFSELTTWWFDQLNYNNLTLDVDSTVITRFGNQGGAEVGYNKNKPGRKSHHPIIAFAAEPRMVINGWMRTGDSSSSTEFKEFLENTFTMIPRARIGLLRGDSGFSGNKVLNELEHWKLDYIIAMPMKSGLVTKILDHRKWIPTSTKGVDVGSFEYRSMSWPKARRIVVVRKDTEKLPTCGGKTLFRDQDDYLRYKYSAYVVHSNLSDELVWRTYKQRAEAENQIKELKMEYAIEGFCLQDFAATEFAFRWVLMAYNMMSYVRNTIAVSKIKHTLSTLKFNCIAIGAYLTTSGRQKKLMLALQGKRQDYLESLFQKIRPNEFSTA